MRHLIIYIPVFLGEPVNLSDQDLIFLGSRLDLAFEPVDALLQQSELLFIAHFSFPILIGIVTKSLFLTFLHHLQSVPLVEALHHALPGVDEPVVDLVEAQPRLSRHLNLLAVARVGIPEVFE